MALAFSPLDGAPGNGFTAEVAGGDPRQDRRPPRALQPRRIALRQLPAFADAAGAARPPGCLAPDRAASPEERPGRALYRPLGLRHRRAAGRRGQGARRLLAGVRAAAALRLSPPLARG